MRVHAEGVRSFDALDHPAELGAHARRSRVCGVHVQPEVRGQRGQGIDRRRGGRADRRADEEGPPAPRAIVGDHLVERRGVHREVRPDRHGAQLDGYSAGGKTGTTLVSIPTGYALDATIASFVGFAPVEQPEIIMLIKIDEPKDDPLGGIVAAPVFAKLAPKILSYLNVQPTEPLARAGR